MGIRILLVIFSFAINFSLVAQDAIDLNKILDRVKSIHAEEFMFDLSMPVLDEEGATNWNIKYFVILQDTVLQNFCAEPNFKHLIPDLVKLLNDDNYAWKANLMLYSITKINAIELQIFAPNKVQEWTENRKEKDITFWRTYKP